MHVRIPVVVTDVFCNRTHNSWWLRPQPNQLTESDQKGILAGKRVFNNKFLPNEAEYTLSYKLHKFLIYQLSSSQVTIDVCLREDLETFYPSEARRWTFHDLNSSSLGRLMKSSTFALGLNHCEIASSPHQRQALFLNSILNPIQSPHVSYLEPHHPIHLFICVLSLDPIRWLYLPLETSLELDRLIHLMRLFGR